MRFVTFIFASLAFFLSIAIGEQSSVRGQSPTQQLQAPKTPTVQLQTTMSQADRCRRLLQTSVIDFYLPHCVDEQFGGYHQELDSNGKFTGQEKFLTLQARQLWFFSTLAVENIQRDAALSAARAGYQFIRKYFYDAERGGYVSKVARDGTIIDTRKHAYLNAFVIYALVEYYRATNDPKVLEQALELFNDLEKHAHDDENLGYDEFFYGDWKPIKDPKEAGYVGAIGVKTYNTHLHLMEAFTSLFRVSKNELVRRRLEELIAINTKTVKHPDYPCNIDAWNPDWSMVTTSQNLRASFGHDVECVWLVLDAANAIGRGESELGSLKQWAIETCQYSVNHGYDTKHGGFFYSGPLGANADDLKKEWWPQSEAIVAMLTMEKLTGNSDYRRYFDETLDFIEQHHVAPGGSWWATLNADGSLGNNRSKTSMWQGAYHNGRSLIESEKRLRELAKAKP